MKKLRLTHQVLEDFPDEIPEFNGESFVEGLTFFIKISLKEFLEKKIKKHIATTQAHHENKVGFDIILMFRFHKIFLCNGVMLISVL